jgi:hypothetical protein
VRYATTAWLVRSEPHPKIEEKAKRLEVQSGAALHCVFASRMAPCKGRKYQARDVIHSPALTSACGQQANARANSPDISTNRCQRRFAVIACFERFAERTIALRLRRASAPFPLLSDRWTTSVSTEKIAFV